FQAEDGIRDSSVTGVQTCALPIFPNETAWKGANLSYDPREIPAQFLTLALDLPQCVRKICALPGRFVWKQWMDGNPQVREAMRRSEESRVGTGGGAVSGA